MARRPRMNWRHAGTVSLSNKIAQDHPPYQPAGSENRWVALWWNRLALNLVLPRHFPEYVSDEDVAETVKAAYCTEPNLWAAMEIPSDFGCYRFGQLSEPKS